MYVGYQKVTNGEFCRLGILQLGILSKFEVFKFYFRKYNLTVYKTSGGKSHRWQLSGTMYVYQ